MRPHHLQMPQHGQITVHEPIDAILHTPIFFRRQPPTRDRAFDAFLETGFGEFVDRCGREKAWLVGHQGIDKES